MIIDVPDWTRAAAPSRVEELVESEGAVARVWLVDAKRHTRRCEIRNHVLRYRCAFVARYMRMVAVIQKSLSRRLDHGSARGIGGFIERHRSRDDLDEDGTWMTVPATLSTGLKRDCLDGKVEARLGLKLHLPVPGDALHLEVRI